eukprot:26836_1
MDTLLVHGYIRTIEKLLKNDMTNTIIPLDIFHICFDYYFSTKFIFYLAALRGPLSSHITYKSNQNDIMCAANIDTKKRSWKISIHELSNNKQITIADNNTNKWCLDVAGITFARNMHFPKPIHHQLSNKSCSNHKFNNIVFRCGGRNKSYDETDYCAALILNSREFQKTESETLTAYNWELPVLPHKIQSTVCLYSNHKNELLSIGGYIRAYTGNIYKLSFCNESYLEQDLKEWKWNKLSTMPTPRGAVCAALIDNSNKLIVIGGSCGYGDDTNIVELLDINNCKWIEVENRKTAALDPGVFYDDLNDLVYVGGGYSGDSGAAVKFVECLDLEKNIWNSLPDTILRHDMNPLMWIEENNLLYIMSIAGNGIEYIDLRENDSWNVIDKDLSTLFRTSFDTVDVNVSRLVGN